MQDKKFTRAKKVIDALRKHYGDNVGQFAARLGVAPSTVSTWANRDSLDEDLVFRKCKGVNYDFLLTGEGEMFVSEEQPLRITEQLAGYSPEVKVAADYLEVKVRGKSPEERLAIVEEIMDEIRRKFK